LASFPSSFWMLEFFVYKHNIFLCLAFWTIFSLFFIFICKIFNLLKVLRMRNWNLFGSLIQLRVLFLMITE
jgi:hypothetical protein